MIDAEKRSAKELAKKCRNGMNNSYSTSEEFVRVTSTFLKNAGLQLNPVTEMYNCLQWTAIMSP